MKICVKLVSGTENDEPYTSEVTKIENRLENAVKSVQDLGDASSESSFITPGLITKQISHFRLFRRERNYELFPQVIEL